MALSVEQWDAYRKSFVFKRELLGWPKVRRVGTGHFVMRAPHMGPRRMQEYGEWKPAVVATGVVLGFLFGVWLPQTSFDFLPVAIFSGAFLGFVPFPFWGWMQGTRLKIHIIGGAISWRGPDRRKHAFKWEEWRELVAVAPHRLGREEAAAHDNLMRVYPRGQRPEPLFQISSELVMQAGLRGTAVVPVAEFYDDLSEEQAGRLRVAILHVVAAACEELDEEALRREEEA